MPKKLFGTSGIRGSAQDLFTDEFCVHIGFVFGSWLKSKGKEGWVAVAMDPRESSPRIKAGVMHGLAATGWEILDEGVVPTPALTYLVRQSSRVGGGVMVTGSHITANLNGVKLLVNGEEVTKTDEVEIEALFQALRSPAQKVNPIVKNESAALDLYVDMLKKLIEAPYPKWKIVIDTTNGAQTEVVRQVFAQMKIKYEQVNEFDIQSPHFVPCDTEIPSMFSDLVRQVLVSKADLGMAFDVDGDRVIFVDDKGRFIPGDYSCALIARESKSQSVVTPVSTSSVIDHIGKKVYRTPVGSTWVSAKMKDVGSTFGFEPNGGSINPEISYGRDGGVTAIKLLNVLKKSGQKLSQAYDSLPVYSLFRQKIDCPFDKYALVLKAVKERYSSQETDNTDGIKVYLSPDDWVLFRGSGNSPEFKVFAQSTTDKKAQELGQDALDLVKNVIVPSQTHTKGAESLDSAGILSSIKAFPDQCRQVMLEMPLQHLPAACMLVDNVVISGMGGSALGGRILANLERQVLRVPLIVSTEYHLPNFVNEKTLVVISSYSGNTEETLSSLDEAQARNAQVFIIASGGKLAEIALNRHLPSYIFSPKHNLSGQPRIGLGYNIMTILSLLARCQLITPPKNLNDLPDFLKKAQSESGEIARQIAQKLVGKIPIILASEHLKGAAHNFKNQLNENAKSFAVYFDLPEANHHLLEGLAFPKTNPENLAAVFLESNQYHPEVRRSYPITEQVFKRQKVHTISMTAQGESPLFEVMYTIQLASLVAFELSQLNAIDPGPIPWIDFFKEEIRR